MIIHDLNTGLAILVSRLPPVLGHLFTDHQDSVSVETMLKTAMIIRLDLNPDSNNFHPYILFYYV